MTSTSFGESVQHFVLSKLKIPKQLEIFYLRPEYTKPSAFQFINIDFALKYPAAKRLKDSWNQFGNNILNIVKNKSNCALICKDIQRAQSAESITFTTLWHSHKLLPPQQSLQTFPSGEKVRKRYSVADSQESCVLLAASAEELEAKIKLLQIQGRSIQPRLLIIGDLFEIQKINVNCGVLLNTYNNGNGNLPGQERTKSSTPSSLYLTHAQQMEPVSCEMNGLAESLIGGVLIAEGLGKYCDSEFVGSATREMQEALDMTPEEMNLAAHQLLSNANVFSDIISDQSSDVPTSPSYAPIHIPTISVSQTSRNSSQTTISSPSPTISSSPAQQKPSITTSNIYKANKNNNFGA